MYLDAILHIIELSIPPDKYSPIGASDINLFLTELFNSFLVISIASFSFVIFGFFLSGKSQNFSNFFLFPFIVRVCDVSN